MFSNDPNKPKRQSTKEPPNTLNKQRVHISNHEKIFLSGERIIRHKDGQLEKVIAEGVVECQDGIQRKPEELDGITYTGLKAPKETLYVCLNPFELHNQFLIWPGHDGKFCQDNKTEEIVPLCNICLEYQEWLLKNRKKGLFGLLFPPQEYK